MNVSSILLWGFAATVLLLHRLGHAALSYREAGLALLSLLVVAALYQFGKRQSASRGREGGDRHPVRHYLTIQGAGYDPPTA